MPQEVSPSILEAIQALVNVESPFKSRSVVEEYRDDLLSDDADSVLLTELNARKNQRAERAVCVFEQWRALLARCRAEGIDRVFAPEGQLKRVELALSVFGLTSGRRLVLIGEEDPVGASPADVASRASFMADLIRPVLTLLDADKQSISRAILQAELSFALARIPEDGEATHFDEAIEQALAAIPILAVAGLEDRLARAQLGLGMASLGRHLRTGADGDLTVGLEACHKAGWLLLLRYDQVHDEKNLNVALDIFRRALRATPSGSHDWPRRRYDLGYAHYFRYKAERYQEVPVDISRPALVRSDPSDLNEAIDAWRDALDASPVDSPARRTYQSDLALALLERFEKLGADEDLDAAIEAQRKLVALGPLANPTWGDSQGKLGMALHSRFLRTWDASDLDESIASIRNALDASAPEGEEWACWQSNLGVALRTRFNSMGELSDLDAAAEALAGALGVTAGKSAEWVRHQYNLALVLLSRFDFTQELGDLDAATNALTSCSALVSEHSNNWARYKSDLGAAKRKRFQRLGEQDDIDSSIEHLEAALACLPEGSLAWARCQGSLGVSLLDHFRAYGEASKLDAAIEALHDGLSLIPERSWDWGSLQMDLGTALSWRFGLSESDADLQATLAIYQHALAAYDLEEYPDHILSVAQALGNLHFSTGSWRAAADAFANAARAFDLLYRRQLLVAGRENWMAQRGNFYQTFAHAQTRAGDLRGAAVTLEQGRARGFREVLDRDRADLRHVQLVDPELYELYQRAAARLRQLAVVERAKGLASVPDHLQMDVRAVREDAHKAHADLEAATTRIRRIHGYEDFLSQPDFDDIIGALRPRLPLVYLSTTHQGSLGLIIHQSNGETEVIIEPVWADDLSKGELDGLLVKRQGETIVGGYLPGQLGSQPWLEASLAEILPLLGDRIIGPVAERLRASGATGLILIPSDRFGLFPLHAARYRVDNRELCLLEEFDVTYAPSAKVLTAATATLATQEDRPPSLVGVGNPSNPRPLHYARAELEGIAALFPEHDRHPLYEENATKGSLFELLSCATHLHMACHGQFDADDPLSSHLQLANDGQLTLRELLDGKRLSAARLVVLSACQTAIHDFLRLPDEAVGLPAGCLQAGASGVVSSLWSVDDMSTAILMFKFYQYHLRGMPSGDGPLPPAHALRRAQLWLRNATNEELSNLFKEYRQNAPDAPGRSRMSYALAQEKFREFTLRDPDERPFADQPYHWAPFIFIGS